MILHTVNQSPFSCSALNDCLKQLADEDKLLLLGDAVSAVCAHVELESTLIQLDKENRLFVLEVELKARGLTANYGAMINYQQFVSLTLQCQSQLAW